MKRLAAWLVLGAMVQSAWAEPAWAPKTQLIPDDPALTAPAAEPPAPSTKSSVGVTVDVKNQFLLSQVIQGTLMEFIQHNYPSRIKMAARSLQSKEGRVHEELLGSMDFLQDFARGPVTIEGALKRIHGATRYVVSSTIHGVAGYPKATIRFETYPGMLQPATDVTVDEDGDGKVDGESSGFRRLQGVRDWLQEQFPRVIKIAAHSRHFDECNEEKSRF